MLRIAIFVLLVIIILVAVNFPKFRRTLGVTLMLMIGAIGVIIWQDTQERELEFARIYVQQAQLSQMQVRPGLNSRSFVVSGRIQNVAQKYTIFSVMLQATIKDCEDQTCKIVGQEDIMVPLKIPPDQARDFSVTIPFSGVPKVRGEAVWDYKILLVRAR
jgi:hypothetical protein